MIHLDNERLCPECNQRINGRTDKKFCNDQCRTAWHNKQYADDTGYVRNVNTILRKNRRILAELTSEGKKEIHSVALTKLGFNFNYFTSARKNRNGSFEHFCYDQAYLPVSNGVYLLKSASQ